MDITRIVKELLATVDADMNALEGYKQGVLDLYGRIRDEITREASSVPGGTPEKRAAEESANAEAPRTADS